uniref:Uncharacterized protein n=1 Tax=Anguilla anguilla TaxID=7936 RepID=A0A0E9Q9G9_ANGAN
MAGVSLTDEVTVFPAYRTPPDCNPGPRDQWGEPALPLQPNRASPRHAALLSLSPV